MTTYLIAVLIFVIGGVFGSIVTFNALGTLGTLLIDRNNHGSYVTFDNNSIEKFPKNGGYIKLKVKCVDFSKNAK